MAHEKFADFFAEVWSDLSSYARTLTGDPGVGDEMAQEALTRVFVRYQLLREPRPYAFRVVTNLARERWLAQHRERSTWQELSPGAVDPPDRDLLDAVQRLKPAHRDVLLLHYWSDLRVEDVAAALRRPTGTIKRRLAEARASLSSVLENQP